MGPVAYVSLCLLGCLIFNPSVAAPALTVQAQDASCPKEWLFIHGNCYKFFSQEKTWMEAEGECQHNEHRAHLASIHSFGENKLLARYVKLQQNKLKHVWIGLWDPEENLNWRWSDESLVNFFAWGNGQPDGPKKKEDCVGLALDEDFQKWHDYPCENKYYFICKFKPKGRKLARTLGLSMPGL